MVLEPFCCVLGRHFGLSEAVLGSLGPQKLPKTRFFDFLQMQLFVLDLFWTYLGLSWAVLDLSWTISRPGGRLGTLRDLLGPILGSILGPNNYIHISLLFWGSFFGQVFRQFLDQFWSILGPDRPQQGPRLAPQLIQNWSHFLVCFWITFYRFCDLRRLPSSGTLSRKVPRASLACAVPYISFYSWAAVRMPL